MGIGVARIVPHERVQSRNRRGRRHLRDRRRRGRRRRASSPDATSRGPRRRPRPGCAPRGDCTADPLAGGDRPRGCGPGRRRGDPHAERRRGTGDSRAAAAPASTRARPRLCRRGANRGRARARARAPRARDLPPRSRARRPGRAARSRAGAACRSAGREARDRRPRGHDRGRGAGARASRLPCGDRPRGRPLSARRRRATRSLTRGATAIREVQSLLRVLATGRAVAEMGAAYGETAAVMAETARTVVTVENDPERVAAARERLDGLANVELREGDVYEELRGRGPFGLVFVDGGRPFDWETILGVTAQGGLIVKDDLTPGRPVAGDDVREFLLRDPRLAATEILVSPEIAVIVAAKL